VGLSSEAVGRASRKAWSKGPELYREAANAVLGERGLALVSIPSSVHPDGWFLVPSEKADPVAWEALHAEGDEDARAAAASGSGFLGESGCWHSIARSRSQPDSAQVSAPRLRLAPLERG
jgi:hypothetical protein